MSWGFDFSALEQLAQSVEGSFNLDAMQAAEEQTPTIKTDGDTIIPAEAAPSNNEVTPQKQRGKSTADNLDEDVGLPLWASNPGSPINATEKQVHFEKPPPIQTEDVKSTSLLESDNTALVDKLEHAQSQLLALKRDLEKETEAHRLTTQKVNNLQQALEDEKQSNDAKLASLQYSLDNTLHDHGKALAQQKEKLCGETIEAKTKLEEELIDAKQALSAYISASSSEERLHEMQSKLVMSENSFAALSAELKVERDALKMAQNSVTENEEALSVARSSLSQMTDKFDIELMKTKKQLDDALTEASNFKEQAEIATAQLSAIQGERDTKDSEAETKAEYLSNKLRDVMKVYNEGKSKLKKFQGDLEAAVASKVAMEQATDDLQKQLKAARVNIDKSEATCLAERQKFAEQAQKHEVEISTLQAKAKELEQRVELERASWAEALQETHDVQLQDVKQNSDRTVKETIKKMHTMEETHSLTISQLQQKLILLEQEQHENMKTVKSHEEYKKRAQQALKAANALAAEKAEDVAKLTQQLDDARSDASGCREELINSTTRVDDLEVRGDAMTRKCESLEQAVSSLQQEAMDLKQQLNDTKSSLDAEKEAAKKTAVASAAAAAVQIDRAIDLTTTVQSRTAVNSSSKASRGRAPSDPSLTGKPESPSQARSNVGSSLNNSTSNGSADNLYYVGTLKSELDELRISYSGRGSELESCRRQLQSEKEAVLRLTAQREELISFIDRSKQVDPGNADSIVNMEYLKNCICKFMATVELKEKRQLFPVIATVLKLTESERDFVNASFAAQERYALEDRVTAGLTAGISRLWGGGR
jgi:hypothetical protein